MSAPGRGHPPDLERYLPPEADLADVCYAVQFAIDRRTDQASSSPYAFALADAARWIAASAAETDTKPDFRTPGRCEMHPMVVGHSRWAAWEPVQSRRLRAVHLDAVEHSPEDAWAWVTRVSIREVDGRASIAISLWRQPARSAQVRGPAAHIVRPAVLSYLLKDQRIALRIGSQDQDGLYQVVRSPSAVGALAESLTETTRLPVVLFHTRTLSALASAKDAAAMLLGLATVITLDLRAAQQLEDVLPGCSPPYAGARLLWSNLDEPAVTVEADVVNGTQPDAAGAVLMRSLSQASLSQAVAEGRGLDGPWRHPEVFGQKSN